jgi:transcription antitermination factor NusG
MNERAASGSNVKSNNAFQVGDEVMFTQGILEGLTGVVSEYGGSRGLLVMTKDWPTGVRVLVTNHSLRKKKHRKQSASSESI